MAKKKPSKPHLVKKVPPAGVIVRAPKTHVPVAAIDPESGAVRVVHVHRDVVKDPTWWERIQKIFE